MAKSTKKVKKRKVKVEPLKAMAFVQATFNNIIVSITNKSGQCDFMGFCR
jgi:small subunit ribosomal protein S11